MNNWKKRALTLAVLAATSVSMLASCGGEGKESSASTPDSKPSSSSTASTEESKQEEENPYAEHMSISMAVWGVGDAITDGPDAVRDKVYDMFNIEIEPYAVTWGDYAEKIKLWSATNKLPDVTAFEAGFGETFRKWRDEGVIRALPDTWKNYENIAKLLDTPEGRLVNEVKQDGDPFYAIPRPNLQSTDEGMNVNGCIIRRDWMNKLGITEVPKTADELIEVLKRFQTEDPDGNGIDDTVGMAAYNLGWMTSLMQCECPEATGGFSWCFAEDGSLIPSFMTEDFYEGLTVLRKFFDAGVVDPDVIIYKGEDGRDKFKNGQAGAYVHCGPDLGGQQIMADHFKNAMPGTPIEDIIAFVPMFPDEQTGEIRYRNPKMNWSETYLSSKVDDAKADRFMAFLNFLLSDEGYELVGLGIEGETFTKNADGSYEMIELKKDDGSAMTVQEKYPFCKLMTLAHWGTYRAAESPMTDPGLKKLRIEYMDDLRARGAKLSDAPMVEGLILKETNDYATANADYDKIINDMMNAPDMRAAWEKMVDDYMKQGYDKVIEEMNRIYKEAGR